MRISTVSDRSAHFPLSPLQPKSKTDVSYHPGKFIIPVLSIYKWKTAHFFKTDVNPNLIKVFYALGGGIFNIGTIVKRKCITAMKLKRK